MAIRSDVALAPYTTLRVGGPARWFVDAQNDDELLAAVRYAGSRRAPFFLLGGGSNLLVSDSGFPGMVVRIASRNIGLERRDGIASIHADAGAEWDAVVSLAAENNAAGIECLAGIPGCVGGTPVQNVGAYGQEVASTITQVHAIDLDAEKVVALAPGDCGFAYRRSIFNSTARGRYAITRVEYALQFDQPPHLAYRDVKQYFAERNVAQPSLAETAAAVREIRARKGMLLSPTDPDSRSAGSFFKNPIVPASILPRLASIKGCLVDEVPQFPASAEASAPAAVADSGADFAAQSGPAKQQGREAAEREGKDARGEKLIKLSAAWLIELAGFHKGFSIGRAGLSTKHVLAIVNRGGSTAAEIVALRDAILAEVYARTAIRLEQEPVLLGFDELRA